MEIFTDIIMQKDGREEIIASVMAERYENGEYHVRRFLDLASYPNLILVDDRGRHPVIAAETRCLLDTIVLQTKCESTRIAG